MNLFLDEIMENYFCQLCTMCEILQFENVSKKKPQKLVENRRKLAKRKVGGIQEELGNTEWGGESCREAAVTRPLSGH